MQSCTFTNDDNVTILLLNHDFSNDLKHRDNHEVIFRRINTFLLKNKLIKNNIIDSGAWIGDNSIPWAKNIAGVVYAIDPCQDNCDFINLTCKLNNIKNVKTIKCAINDTNEVLTTNDGLQHCSFVYRYSGLDGINRVNSVSLDFLHETKQIENIGYIHLDVEGMEYKAIRGSAKLLDKYRPIVSFEQHLEIDDYDGIVAYLKTKGYSVFLVDEVLPGCRQDCRNSFAFPNEMASQSLIYDIHRYIGRNVLIPK